MSRCRLAVVSAAMISVATPLAHGEDAPPPAESHQRMVQLLAAVADDAADTNVYVGDRQARAFRQLLAELPPRATAKRRWQLLRQVAHHELRLGNDEAAIARLQDAWALVPAIGKSLRAADADRTQFALAVAYLRWGEKQNCVARHTSESCILPIAGDGVHQNQEGSRRAITTLEALLARNPKHLPARWLLNLAYMTVGGYPQDIPAALRVSPQTFASDEVFVHFTNAAPGRGLASRDLGGGVAIDDFDADGHLDLVVSSAHPASPLRYYAGSPDHTFVERSSAAGFDGITGGANIVQADYDNDGAIDLLVLRGAWLGREGRQPKSLLHNDGHGVFRDVTFRAGLGAVHYPSQTAAWADYDNDSDLDLYVGNEWGGNSPFPSQLFRNDGHGNFINVAAAAGVENRRLAKGVAWGDFDGDQRPDLYVSNLNADNRLYRNRGDGTFVDIAATAGVTKPWGSLAVVTWDFDNDGRLDLFVGATAPRHGAELVSNRSDELAALSASIASSLGLPHRGEYGRLYRNVGDGRFRDVTVELGLAEVILSGGLGVGDLDSDGFLDLYVGTSYGGYEGLLPNRAFRNRGGVGFADVTTAAGLGHLQKAAAIAIADIDADGDTDIFVNAGGMYKGDAFGDALFVNPGTSAHWLDVRLVGVGSNRSAIGARIRCDVTSDGRRHTIYRTIGSGSSFGANPLRQHIGIGEAREVERLEVAWPSSGVTQVLHRVPADRALEIIEPQPLAR